MAQDRAVDAAASLVAAAFALYAVAVSPDIVAASASIGTDEVITHSDLYVSCDPCCVAKPSFCWELS